MASITKKPSDAEGLDAIRSRLAKPKPPGGPAGPKPPGGGLSDLLGAGPSPAGAGPMPPPPTPMPGGAGGGGGLSGLLGGPNGPAQPSADMDQSTPASDDAMMQDFLVNPQPDLTDVVNVLKAMIRDDQADDQGPEAGAIPPPMPGGPGPAPMPGGAPTL